MPRKSSIRKSDVSSKSVPPSEDALEMKVVVMAEEVGRLIAAVQTKTERWLDQASVRDQLTRIRDGAAELMTHLTPAGAPAPTASNESKEKTKHRSAPPSVHGAKHSDERMAKMKSAAQSRSRSRG